MRSAFTRLVLLAIVAFAAGIVATGSSIDAQVAPSASNVTPIYEGGGAVYPDWSPDGSQIAVQLYERGIGLMNADGTGLVNIAPGVEAEQPSWAPDGTAIAYVADLDVWVMNADGSQQTQITDLFELGLNSPSWGLPAE